MVEVIQSGVETRVVDEVQRIDWLQEAVVLVLVQLLDHGFGGVEDDALLELVIPVHLHLHDEVATARFVATHIDDAVLL